jgi:SSS family solute:Na+ symporter
MTPLLAKTPAFMEIATFIGYFVVLMGIAFFSYQRQKSNTDFIIGNRSLNFWLTALSAHASDMSSWLFLAYPAMVFSEGVFAAWAAVGLTGFMFLNWHFIAPRLRTITEQSNSLTLSSFFEARFGDVSGKIRLVSALMSVVFFTFYISSGLVAMGLLVESLFGLSYNLGISIGLAIVVLYVFMGGYRTVAWIDLFQGFFLLGVIVFIPTVLIWRAGGMGPVMDEVRLQHLSTSFFPDFKMLTLFKILMGIAAWGLGYFGQPHIITKFMGIRQVSDMSKAKCLGISWQVIALTAATLVGLVGIYFFPHGINDPQQLILEIVKSTFPAFVAGLVLCAILAATTNVMAAQILVVASNLAEDFYKRIIRKGASANELLWASRASVVLVGLVGFVIAFFKVATIYTLVLYSWSGLGAAFGPLVLLSLYSKRINRHGAFAGILVGGVVAAIWPYLAHYPELSLVPAVLAGFICSLIAMFAVSLIFRVKNPELNVSSS